MLITLILFSVKGVASQKESLLWCVDDIPVRHYYNEGKLKGTTVDFMQALAEKSGFALRYTQNTPFSRCLMQMQAGEADLMMALNKNDERSQYMHLFPVYKARSETLFTTTEGKQAFSQLGDIRDNTLATISGYLYNTSDLSLLQNHNQIISAYSVEGALAMLIRGKVDLVVAPHFSTLARIQSNPHFKNNIVTLPITLGQKTTRYVHLGISKQAKLPAEQVDTIRQALQTLKESGEAERLLFPAVVKSL
ncbi:substrate-binding periplasmic protein [Alteromonas sediminis]|nr:transporter substrate-binding domain-containing protein [Alteromonas sediminis]